MNVFIEDVCKNNEKKKQNNLIEKNIDFKYFVLGCMFECFFKLIRSIIHFRKWLVCKMTYWHQYTIKYPCIICKTHAFYCFCVQGAHFLMTRVNILRPNSSLPRTFYVRTPLAANRALQGCTCAYLIIGNETVNFSSILY